MSGGRSEMTLGMLLPGALAWLVVAATAGGCHDVSKIAASRPALDGGLPQGFRSPGGPADALRMVDPCAGKLTLVRGDGTTTSGAPIPRSCQDLPATCGPAMTDSCCQYSPELGNATFARGYDRSRPVGP